MVIVSLLNRLVQFSSGPSISTINRDVDALDLASSARPSDAFESDVC